jgi:hypothetical protein
LTAVNFIYVRPRSTEYFLVKPMMRVGRHPFASIRDPGI